MKMQSEFIYIVTKNELLLLCLILSFWMKKFSHGNFFSVCGRYQGGFLIVSFPHPPTPFLETLDYFVISFEFCFLIVLDNQLSWLLFCNSRSQWPRSLRCGSAAARLLGLWVQIPAATWMSVCCECCVLSGRGLCVGLITRPEESYRVRCVWVWSWSLDNEALAQ
jgi:hypothetical protein